MQTKACRARPCHHTFDDRARRRVAHIHCLAECAVFHRLAGHGYFDVAVAHSHAHAVIAFDHDLGTFELIGTGTVTDDGMLIVSDPGFGIVKGG